MGLIIKAGSRTLYHSGDTVYYGGMVETLRSFRIDVALLPINGRAPERRVAGNLTGPEAANIAKEIHAKLVVPCHYDMFEFNTASPDEFVATCQRLRQPYRLLAQGERLSLSDVP
jgi:L-ascorbate metabolism protein UlaG (beta-lactamase superfamily)